MESIFYIYFIEKLIYKVCYNINNNNIMSNNYTIGSHSFTCEKCAKTFRILLQTPEQNTNNATNVTNVTNINTSTSAQLQQYYDKVLNLDKSTYKSSNDEPTPINCIKEMIAKLPDELWRRPDLKILDPCCGNGNFAIPVLEQLLHSPNAITKKHIMENVLYFNDTNQARLQNVRSVFCADTYNLHISADDFLTPNASAYQKYDLIMVNPPYAKLMEDGKRASKNHNLIKDFIEASLAQLKPNGYLLFITPDNWMSYADRNQLIERLTSLQIIHLDIHGAKRHFKKIGSSFTWYIIQNCAAYKNMTISGLWKNKSYTSSVISKPRKFIPLFYTDVVESILSKTVNNADLAKFEVKTSSDLHRFTKNEFISNDKTATHIYKLIHTPKQTVYASRPHKYQEGYKVFMSTTDKYGVFVDNCGMTQSIVFILCGSKEQAESYKQILEHPMYVFINNICRWGNFNNIRILQHFPKPPLGMTSERDIYEHFGISAEEQTFIQNNL